MYEFLDSPKQPKLYWEINSLSRHITNDEIEIVIECLPNK